MSKVGLWSTTAGNNNSAPPDGWPEGQAPSTVNDCARENMAAIKTAMQDMDFFDHAFSPTYINANSFSVPGNQTSRLNNGRKLKLFDATTHVRSIGSASFTVVTTVSLGAGTALTSSLSSFAVSIINPTSSNIPNTFDRISASAAEITTTLTVGGTTTLVGLKLTRADTSSAGGSLQLARANDNTDDWSIDSFGAESGASSTKLRFSDRNLVNMAMQAGAVSVGVKINAPTFRTAFVGPITASSGVSTTLYTALTASAATALLVSVNIGVGDPANYGAFAVYAIEGTLSRKALNGDAALCTISANGLNIVAIQSSGATQSLYASIIRMGF